MHSSIAFGDGNFLYCSDSFEGTQVQVGNNTTVHLQVDNEADVYRIVNALSAGGTITMAASKTFWNSVYGSLVDRYGVCWGIEFSLD